MENLNLLEQLMLDKNLLKKIAARYIELGEFKYVELDLHLPLGSIDECFDESPDISDEFDGILSDLTMKKLKREGTHKIFKIIKTLYNAVESTVDVEDGGPNISDKIRASSTLAKLLDPPKARGKKANAESDFEKLMKEIENDS